MTSAATSRSAGSLSAISPAIVTTGHLVTIAVALPGGIPLALRQLRIRWLRNSPLMMGWMARRPLPDDLVRGWTEPALRDKAIRRDLVKYAKSGFPKAELIANTEACNAFPATH
jgi:hypothetical protein